MSRIVSILETGKSPPATAAAQLGSDGERIAALYLETNGNVLVVSNFKVPIGRNSRGVAVTGEIDIICLDGEVLCFVEVKTKASEEFAAPIAAVNLRKQRQITRTARIYRRIFRLQEMSYRFDVVSIVMGPGRRPAIEHIKGFWAESKFRKKRAWSGDIY